ncbi:MAG: EF-P lysine aminoacylase EpmA [Candidatus Gottesmanbacteria bacterium]
MNTWRQLRATPKLFGRYFVRERVIKIIRSFFDKHQFHEVETPILIAHPAAESYLDVFETTLLDRNRNKKVAYLSTSPELALKKLIVAGIGNCYSITKSFRNTETNSNTHMPEFSILEWYRVGSHYEKIMDDCEKLLRSICLQLTKSTILHYQGISFDLNQKWERISVKEAFKQYADVDLDTFFSLKKAQNVSKERGYTILSSTTWEELYNQMFLNEIEPHLGKEKPTIIYGFPNAVAALSKKNEDDPRYANRFEFYIGGLELGDCYEELTDWKEQQKRFDAELAEIKRLGKTSYVYDHDFIKALKVGMPETSGIAVGLDRLIMLFGNMTDISDTTFFPSKELFEK